MRGRFDPGDHRFRPQVVEVVDVWKLNRGWDPVVPGWRWHCFRAPANHRSAGGVGFSTPYGAVSTRGITVFVPRLLDLYMYGGISDLGMRPCRPRMTLALFSSPSQSAIGRRGWGFHTVRCGFDPGDHRFRPPVVGVVDGYGRISEPGMGTYPPRVRRDRGVSPRGNPRLEPLAP